MAVNLPNFPEFDMHPRDTAPVRFDKYLKRLNNLFMAMCIDNDDQKKAMLLHYIGEEACDLHDTLAVPAVVEGGPNVYELVTKAFTDHFEPQRCADHHVYNFRKEQQKPGESISEFYTRLRTLAKKCEFHDDDVEIKRQIISGTTNTRLRRKSIERSLNLDRLLKTARAMETADEQSLEMEQQTSHAMQHRKSGQRRRPVNRTADAESKTNHKSKCGLCGGNYPHSGKCPASGKICNYCEKPNHFANVCRSKERETSKQHKKSKPEKYQPKHRARVLESEGASSPDDTLASSVTHNPSDEDEYTFHLADTTNVVVNDKPLFSVKVSGTPLEVMADSGATVSIINQNDFNRLKDKPDLMQSKSKVYPYMSSKPLNLQGKFQADVSNGNCTCRETFLVVNGPSRSILSWKTSQKLKLITVVSAVDDQKPNLLEDFPAVTASFGACKCEPVKVHVDESIKPIAQPHRRIPFHVRKKVEEKLLELQEADIIEPAEGPTPWISPIVIVPKPNNPDEIRICIDMRAVNQAIIRERHVIPTIDDIVADLNGCKVFSKIDLKQGYHQILLHPESRSLTTFSSHIGLWRYKRLNFGMSCSAEVFQKIISDIISGIEGVKNISDDIYIGGKNTEEHDQRLRMVLRRLTDNNLRVNMQKCKIRVSSMLFFGHVFSGQGISPDPKKVNQIQGLDPPTNVTEVRSLLSSASFCSRYVKDFATITRPLRKLTHKDEPWQWSEPQKAAFTKLKTALSESTTLGYFDPEKQTVIYTDGSPVGLGAVLTQTSRDNAAPVPLYYASYPLTATEARYPQIDREALSIYWAIKRFHLYVYGKDFKIVTDHQPLVSLFNNPSSKPSARIERWLMELQRYRFTVEYQPGKNNPADYSSRHPIETPEERNLDEGEDADNYVAFIATNAVPKAMSLEEINLATASDPLLQAVTSSLKSGKWYKPPSGVSLSELSRFEIIKSELTYIDEPPLVLKSNRIVIPTALQERTVDIAHEAHLGIAKTKALMREKVWFPLMDKLVEQKIKSCLPCQIATPTTNREPLKMTPLPGRAFELTSVDFAHIDGETVMLFVDDYSRFPFVEPVRSTAASAVIPKLDQIFAMFGTPETVKSDNGPPFNGEEFAKFASTIGFHHRKVTPLWPRANGEVERFVQTLKKHVKVAKAQGVNWKKALQAFLRGYRSTAHCTTGVAPATLFLKRVVKTKLPAVIEDDPASATVRVRDSEQKRKMKEYADRARYVKPCDLQIGDSVLVKTPFNLVKGNLPYETTPLVVTQKKGSMITASDEGRQVTRNSSFFKRISHDYDIPRDEEVEMEPDICTPMEPDTCLPPVIPETSPTVPLPTETVLRRSTRARKAPDRLNL